MTGNINETVVVKKKRVAIYIRVSTDEQKKDGFSLSAQEEVLRKYCEAMGFEVYYVYEDGGYSGKDFNRPGMQQLLKDLKRDKFDIVLAVAVDRISRSNLDVLTFIDRELHPRGKKLLISTCDIDSSTETGKMFISLLGTFAEYERKLTISRVKNGMEKRASEGKWNSGAVFGYDVVGGKLVINEAEASIVKEIFELRLTGKGYKTIAVSLNDRGKKTKKGKAFSINTVKTILENELYIGNITWGKFRDWSNKRRNGKSSPMVVKGEHTAIISDETWGKVKVVQQLNAESQVSASNIKGEFILSGLLRCPSCGAGTVMSKSKKRDGTGYHLYYMCQNNHSKGKSVCGSNLMKKEVVEEQVVNAIRFMVNEESIIEGILSKLSDDVSRSTSSLEVDLKLQQAVLKKINEKQSQLDEDYYSKEISASVYSKLTEKLEIERHQVQCVIQNIEREIERAKDAVHINKDLVHEALKQFNEMFNGASNEEKKALLRALVKEVHMESDRKTLKKIVLWFLEDDDFTESGLPVGEAGRALP
ncbi:recombinase family protein [Paenibacillus chitinolyticus]|uniref:recombinase family protein n=1 Tax=Paenibacillus chitinolyticus TaxID=79263 RepID=UPI0036DAB3A4